MPAIAAVPAARSRVGRRRSDGCRTPDGDHRGEGEATTATDHRPDRKAENWTTRPARDVESEAFFTAQLRHRDTRQLDLLEAP